MEDNIGEYAEQAIKAIIQRRDRVERGTPFCQQRQEQNKPCKTCESAVGCQKLSDIMGILFVSTLYLTHLHNIEEVAILAKATSAKISDIVNDKKHKYDTSKPLEKDLEKVLSEIEQKVNKKNT